MTARLKITLILGALVAANLAIYGAKQILSGLYDPIIRALGA
jgi:hypothetical protein